MFSYLGVKLSFLDRNFALGYFRLFFLLCDIGVCSGDFYRFTLRFLLNGIRRVRFRAFIVCLYLHFRPLNVEFGILLGNLFLSFYLYRVRLFFGMSGCDCDISLSVCLCDLRVFAYLLHVVDTHVFDGPGVVLKVLNIEVYHLDTQFFHIRNNVFGYLLCNALTILDHFFQTNRTDYFTHVTFKHLRDEAYQFVLALSEQRFRRTIEKKGIGRYFDVGNTVNVYVYKFVGGNRFAGFYVHLHYFKR